jgi:hypothetical protein
VHPALFWELRILQCGYIQILEEGRQAVKPQRSGKQKWWRGAAGEKGRCRAGKGRGIQAEVKVQRYTEM